MMTTAKDGHAELVVGRGPQYPESKGSLEV